MNYSKQEIIEAIVTSIIVFIVLIVFSFAAIWLAQTTGWSLRDPACPMCI